MVGGLGIRLLWFWVLEFDSDCKESGFPEVSVTVEGLGWRGSC